MGAILPDGDERAIPTRDVGTFACLLDEAGDGTVRPGRRVRAGRPGQHHTHDEPDRVGAVNCAASHTTPNSQRATDRETTARQ